AGAQLGRYARSLAPDPARLETVERRLAELARLQKKYGGSVADLVARRDALAGELERAAEGEGGMAALGAAVAQADREARESAEPASAARRRAAGELEQRVEGELRQLALEGARFEVRVRNGRPLGPAGCDEIEFFLAANPGEEPRPLARVPSGGE